jgi:hypothetical protein
LEWRREKSKNGSNLPATDQQRLAIFAKLAKTRFQCWLLKPSPRNGSRRRLQMSPIGSDDFWEDLLDFVEQGKVIPVIGEHAVTFGESNELLYPWLAQELAARLSVNGSKLTEMPTVNDVAREHLLAGGERNAIYTRLSTRNARAVPCAGRRSSRLGQY